MRWNGGTRVAFFSVTSQNTSSSNDVRPALSLAVALAVFAPTVVQTQLPLAMSTARPQPGVRRRSAARAGRPQTDRYLDGREGGACEPASDDVDMMCDLASKYGKMAQDAAKAVEAITSDDLLHAAYDKASKSRNTVLKSVLLAFGEVNSVLESGTAGTAGYVLGTLQNLAERMSDVCDCASVADVVAFLSPRAAQSRPLEPWACDVYQDLYIKCVPKIITRIQVFFMSGKRTYLDLCVPCTARSLLQHPTVKAEARAQKKTLRRVIHGGAEANIVTAAMGEVHIV